MPKKKVPFTEYQIEQTSLSEERTLYSKERTILNAIGLFIAVIGLGLAIEKFFQEHGFLGMWVVSLGVLGAACFGYQYWKLDRFVKKVEARNRVYFLRLKQEINKR